MHYCRAGHRSNIKDGSRIGEIQCIANTFSIGANDTCMECDDGASYSKAGESACTPCPQYEVYDISSGTCLCRETFLRENTSSAEAEACTCAPGQTLMGTSCQKCEFGKWKSDYGVKSCTRCELEGSITLANGAKNNDACICPQGKYQDEGKCENIRKGMNGKVNGTTLETVPLLTGFWRTSLNSTEVLRCSLPKSCSGGEGTGNESDYCAEGHRGPYCSLCKPDYAKDPFMSCKHCPSTLENILKTLGFIFGLALIASCVYLIMKRAFKGREASAKRFKTGLKIIFTGMQIMSALPSTIPSLPMPKTFKSVVIENVQLLNFNPFEFESLGCFANASFLNYYYQVACMSVPVILLCCAFVMTGLFRMRARKKCVSASLAITYLTLPAITTATFGLFPCEKFDDGRNLLIRDYSINCDATDRHIWEAFGGILILLFPIGVMMIYALVLLRNRSKLMSPEKRATSKGLSAIAFLWEPYKPEFWYFELVETFRRLMLTGVLSIIEPGTFKQCVCGMLISTSFTVIYCLAQPFHDARDNVISTLTGIQLVLIFIVSSYMKHEEDREQQQEEEAIDSEFQGVDVLLLVTLSLIFLTFFFWAYFEKKDNSTKSSTRMAMEALKMKSIRELHALGGELPRNSMDIENGGSFDRSSGASDFEISEIRRLVEELRAEKHRISNELHVQPAAFVRRHKKKHDFASSRRLGNKEKKENSTGEIEMQHNFPKIRPKMGSNSSPPLLPPQPPKNFHQSSLKATSADDDDNLFKTENPMRKN